MSDDRTSMLERFQELPRVLHWVSYAAIFAVLYLAWDQSLGPLATEWSSQADKIEVDVEAVRRGERLADRLNRKNQTIRALGEVGLPATEREGREAMTSAVIQIIDAYKSVRDDEFNLGSARNLRSSLADKINSASPRRGAKLVQLSGELKFKASPDETIKIISDFEARTEITSISQVRIRTDDNNKLDVTLTLEAWAFEA